MPEPRQGSFQEAEREQSWAVGSRMVRSFLEDHPTEDPPAAVPESSTPNEEDFCTCGGAFVPGPKGTTVCFACGRPKTSATDEREEVK